MNNQILDTVNILQNKSKSFSDLDMQIKLHIIIGILHGLLSYNKFYIKIMLSDETENINYEEVNNKINEVLKTIKIEKYIRYALLDDKKRMVYELIDMKNIKRIEKVYNYFICKISDIFEKNKKYQKNKEVFYTIIQYLYLGQGTNNLTIRYSNLKSFSNFPFIESIINLIKNKYIDFNGLTILLFTDGKIDLTYNIILSSEFEKIIKDHKSKNYDNEIELLDSKIIYNKQSHIFYRKENSAEYEIPETYFKFMEILTVNKGERVDYKDIQEYAGLGDISDGTYKANLKKALQREGILLKKEEIIFGKNKGYLIK